MKAHNWTLIVTVMLLAAGLATVAGDGHNRWTDRNAVIIHGEDAEHFDVADLRDGETRTFGRGDERVVATRNGDVVTLTREDDDARPIEIRCETERDHCAVITGADGDDVSIIVQKSRTCINGDGDCDSEVLIRNIAQGEGLARIILDRELNCGDDDDCEQFEVLVEAHGEGGHWASADGHTIAIAGDDDIVLSPAKKTLRCPEGDTTTRIDEDLASQTFLCPQHSVPLEEVKMPKVRRIHFARPDKDDDKKM